MPLNGTRPSAVAASTLCRHFYALRESFTSYESSPDQCDPASEAVRCTRNSHYHNAFWFTLQSTSCRSHQLWRTSGHPDLQTDHRRTTLPTRHSQGAPERQRRKSCPT